MNHLCHLFLHLCLLDLPGGCTVRIGGRDGGGGCAVRIGGRDGGRGCVVNLQIPPSGKTDRPGKPGL